MNIVIPMAGAGSRFTQAGFDIPKPFIMVRGKPMYRWAVDSLPLQSAKNLVFILREDNFTEKLILDIKSNYGQYDPKIKVLNSLTRGQAETVYLAKYALDLSQPILIHNADTAFMTMQSPCNDCFGALVVFKPAANDARWSFAKTSDHDINRVIEVREKIIISEHASTGTYYFSDTQWLLNTIKYNITHNIREKGEFYLAPLYNQAIAEKKDIQLLHCSNFTCMGTPEELKVALESSDLFN